jgi:hypothetical protein
MATKVKTNSTPVTDVFITYPKENMPTPEQITMDKEIAKKAADNIPLTPQEADYLATRKRTEADKVSEDMKKGLPAREAEDRRKRAAAGGPGSTILTSPLGLPPEPQNVKRKTLLGM